MGIFDKLMGSKDVNLTPRGAMALAALTIVSADGVVDQDEVAGLVKLVRGDKDAFEKALKVLREQPFEQCVAMAAKALDAKQRRLVMANILDLAMSDGILAGAEKNLLLAYAKAFELGDEDLKPMIEMVALKNDFSVMK